MTLNGGNILILLIFLLVGGYAYIRSIFFFIISASEDEGFTCSAISTPVDDYYVCSSYE